MLYSKIIRIIAIIQLCLVFSLLSWHMSYPFMGKHFALKSKKQLTQTVLGQDQCADQEIMARNRERFNALPDNQKLTIYRYLDDINYKLKHSFAKKVVRSIHIVSFEISPIEQMWIVVSILVSLLVLLNFEAARQVALLLPLIAICYSLDNRYNGFTELSKEAALFPSEESIRLKYLHKPLSPSIKLQQGELMSGWRLYLIRQWAGEIPSEDQNEQKKQIETGEYRFQAARVLAQATQPPSIESYTFKRQQSIVVLALYVLWNLFFAWFANKPQMKSIHGNSQATPR